MLLWLENTGRAPVGGRSLNKCGVCLFKIWQVVVVLLSLAGHGGEGREDYGADACRSASWRGRKLHLGDVYMVALSAAMISGCFFFEVEQWVSPLCILFILYKNKKSPKV
jgi:hypothetical protein